MRLWEELPFFSGTAEELAERLATPQSSQTLVFTVNTDFLALAAQSPAFDAVLRSADIVTADGTPILWLRRLSGCPAPPRITGADLVPAVARRVCAHHGRIFILGASKTSRLRGQRVLQVNCPSLAITGLSPDRDTLFTDALRICHAISAYKPTVLFVALGAPLQEQWIHQNRLNLPRMAIVGVGAAIDFISGVQHRAPKWCQRLGAEWMWRLTLDPPRLARRYLLRDIPHLLKEAAYAVSARNGRLT